MRHSASRIAWQGAPGCPEAVRHALFAAIHRQVSRRSVADTLNGKAAEERHGRGEAVDGS